MFIIVQYSYILQLNILCLKAIFNLEAENFVDLHDYIIIQKNVFYILMVLDSFFDFKWFLCRQVNNLKQKFVICVVLYKDTL